VVCHKNAVGRGHGAAVVSGTYRLAAEHSTGRRRVSGNSGISQRRDLRAHKPDSSAAVSIPSNIAEGQGRLSRGEFKQFLGHARGSIFELESQLLIARSLDYFGDEETRILLGKVAEVARILNGLLRSLGHGVSG